MNSVFAYTFPDGSMEVIPLDVIEEAKKLGNGVLKTDMRTRSYKRVRSWAQDVWNKKRKEIMENDRWAFLPEEVA